MSNIFVRRRAGETTLSSHREGLESPHAEIFGGVRYLCWVVSDSMKKQEDCALCAGRVQQQSKANRCELK
jgi:hypothetical protein